MKKAGLDYQEFLALYEDFKKQELTGRYITYSHIKNPMERLAAKFPSEEIGNSTLGIPIRKIKIGKGKIKILAWSQMHGNETTTTKAVFDLLSAFEKHEENTFFNTILSNCTLSIIPMLNPDGAQAYTRENANGVDLNRDAFDLHEKESKLLRKEFDEFKPDFCFNLHDQRTIFSAGAQPYPATLSFLTPSSDPERKITPSRERSMKVIAAMAKDLEEALPDQIGRYDDAFNQNCTGDSFQRLNVPTVLFEAGHYKGDYQRELSRKYVAFALCAGLFAIASENFEHREVKEYFEIPENKRLFHDIILRNFRLNDRDVNIAIQYKESLKENQIYFVPVIALIAPSIYLFGHAEIDCKKSSVQIEAEGAVNENVLVKRILINNEVFTINYENF